MRGSLTRSNDPDPSQPQFITIEKVAVLVTLLVATARAGAADLTVGAQTIQSLVASSSSKTVASDPKPSDDLPMGAAETVNSGPPRGRIT